MRGVILETENRNTHALCRQMMIVPGVFLVWQRQYTLTENKVTTYKGTVIKQSDLLLLNSVVQRSKPG